MNFYEAKETTDPNYEFQNQGKLNLKKDALLSMADGFEVGDCGSKGLQLKSCYGPLMRIGNYTTLQLK